MESPVLRIEVSSTSLRMELPMSETNSVSPLRQRMIEDMAARKLNPHTQRSHVYSCKRFAAWLKRSPDTATPDDVRRFQLYLIESGASICNRNRIVTGVKFLFRVALLRHKLACGLTAGEIVRLKAGDIDSARNIFRIVPSTGRKHRHVNVSNVLISLKERPGPKPAHFSMPQRVYQTLETSLLRL